MRTVRRLVPVAPDGDGARLLTRVGGRGMATPMLLLIIAIAATDLAFAFDSIPAIFGLTRDPYLVFTANVFALLGLRQPVLPHRRPAAAAGPPVGRAWPSSSASSA